MRRGRERLLDAYRDGALSEWQRRRIESRLARDPASAERVRATQVLGSAVRGAWNDGPASLSPEYLIATLRPEMVRIDAELSGRARVGPWLAWIGAELRSFVPSRAPLLAGAAALALFFAFPSLVEPPGRELPVSRLSNFVVHQTTSIYDLAQEDTPLLILESEDGSTLIWFMEPPEELSSFPTVADGWA